MVPSANPKPCRSVRPSVCSPPEYSRCSGFNIASIVWIQILKEDLAKYRP